MKWLILLKAWNDQAEGAKIQVSDADAKTLVADGTARECTDAENPETKAADEMGARLGKAVADAVEIAVDGAVQKLSNFKVPVTVKDSEAEARGGFEDFGEFAIAAKAFGKGNIDDRIAKIISVKAPTGMSEGVDSDGGLLVPPEFSQRILDKVFNPVDLIGRTDSLTIRGNSIRIPMENESSRADGSRHGGTRGYWVEEARSKTASKPTFTYANLRPKKMAVLIYATDELIEDSSIALATYLTKKAGDEISFVTNAALMAGTGAGMPLGILNAPCLVSVAKEVGQAADTLVSENIMKMWSRMFGPCRQNAIWLINQECEPQLMTMTINVGTGGIPVYMPANGLSERPYALLMGRPVLPCEWSEALGDQGDIALCDWSQYLSVTKGAIKTAMSIHLRFDYDETVFRFVFRVDGQPWWPLPLTPYKGAAANTLSPFVVLDDRA